MLVKSVAFLLLCGGALLAQAASPSWGEWGRFGNPLSPQTQRAVDQALVALDHDEPGVRERAARELTRMGLELPADIFWSLVRRFGSEKFSFEQEQQLLRILVQIAPEVSWDEFRTKGFLFAKHSASVQRLSDALASLLGAIPPASLEMSRRLEGRREKIRFELDEPAPYTTKPSGRATVLRELLLEEVQPLLEAARQQGFETTAPGYVGENFWTASCTRMQSGRQWGFSFFFHLRSNLRYISSPTPTELPGPLFLFTGPYGFLRLSEDLSLRSLASQPFFALIRFEWGGQQAFHLQREVPTLLTSKDPTHALTEAVVDVAQHTLVTMNQAARKRRDSRPFTAEEEALLRRLR